MTLGLLKGKIFLWIFRIFWTLDILSFAQPQLYSYEVCLLVNLTFLQQVDKLLNEVKPSMKKMEAVTHFVEKLRSSLLRMKQGKHERQVFVISSYFKPTSVWFFLSTAGAVWCQIELIWWMVGWLGGWLWLRSNSFFVKWILRKYNNFACRYSMVGGWCCN